VSAAEPALLVRLRDAPALCIAEFGDPRGRPLLYFHGWPSCRLEAKGFDPAGAALGVRVIGVDRPGIAGSPASPGFTIAAWPALVAQLADALGLGRFSVVGVSSGAPYALACARFLGERLAGAGCVSGVGPLDVPHPHEHLFAGERFLVALARRAPWATRILLRGLAARIRRHPERFLASLARGASPPDRALLAQPEFARDFREALLETLRGEIGGLAESIALEGGPWGFAPEDIAMPVRLWHGALDDLVFPRAARELARRIPRATLSLGADDGHLSTVARHAREIVAELTRAD
jgi:pimeloyl-ACP methyl ester carboxylesterase